MKITLYLTTFLSAILPLKALNSDDIKGSILCSNSFTSNEQESISVNFLLTGPKGSALSIDEDQELKVSYTTEGGEDVSSTLNVTAFFCSSHMGNDHILNVRGDFPLTQPAQTVRLNDTITILGAEALFTSPAQTIDVEKGGRLNVEGMDFTYKLAENVSGANKQGVQISYNPDACEALARFEFFDAEGKALDIVMQSSSSSGKNKDCQYCFNQGELPKQISISCYRGLKELKIPLDLNFKPNESGQIHVDMMPPQKELSPLDMSKMSPAQQKMLYTMAAYMLLGQSKLIEEDKQQDISAVLSVGSTMMTKANSPDLPQDYQNFLKEAGALLSETAKQTKMAGDSPEATMAVVFTMMPKIDEINKKYPEVVAFLDAASISAGNSNATSVIDTCTIFGLEKQVEAYTQKLKASGMSDEKELHVKVSRAAAQFLIKKAKAIK